MQRDAMHTNSATVHRPSKRILRRWFCLTKHKLQQHHDTEKLLVALESRQARLEPKLRLTLPKEAYDVFLHIFEDKSIVSELLETFVLSEMLGVAQSNSSVLTHVCTRNR